MKSRRRIPSPIALGLLHGAGLVSSAAIERIADRAFGNVDLSTTPYQPPSQASQDKLIAAAAAKRARKAARR